MASILGNVTLPTELILSFALGHAAGPALEPFAQSLANEAWQTHTVKPPTIYTVVRMVAEGKLPADKARTWAHEQGFSDDVFNSLVAGSRAGADFANLMNGWRRGLIGQAEFETGLTNLGVMDTWVPMLEGLKREHLTPAEAANARQQQFITDQQQRDIAALYGITQDDADVQFKLAGLPPGIETGLQMWRRGIVDQATFDQIVAEGHTKTKYTSDLEQLKRQLLSPATAVRARLKGHIGDTELHARGADWGYTADDMDLWELTEGRPATAHQIHIGYARGATLPGAADEHDAIATSVRQSDIRPEYTDIIFAGRANYPSVFQLNRLVAAGAITPAIAADWATKSGEAHEVVTVLEQYWQSLGAGGSTGSGTDTHVAKAQTQVWTATHKAYVDSLISNATATSSLSAAGVAAAAIPTVLAAWQVERDLIRKSLSASQIKKAWFEQIPDPELGRPWTEAEAVTRLQELGYTADDAKILLVE